MQLILAFFIMLKAHFFQKDKGGKWYIFHPLYLSTQVKGYNEKIVALLHDVVEDSNYTVKDLKKYFDKEIINAVEIITKNKKMNYMNYLNLVKNNEIARKVKIEDLKHNSNINRLKTVEEKDIERLAKYRKALLFLNT